MLNHRNKNRKLVNRRNFLFTLAGLASFVPLAYASKRKDNTKIKNLSNPNRNFSVFGNSTLRDRAAAKGLIYGAFSEGGYKPISASTQLKSSYIQNCGLMVGGFYWTVTRPGVDSFDFSDNDSFLKFASDNGMLFRGHPLIWYQQNPQWLTDKFQNPNTTSQEIRNIFVNHISTVVKRYSGKIHSWDVVNEAIEPNDKRTDGLRSTPWLQYLGPNYIELAFRTAAKSDPKAMLVYNDYGIEYDTPEEEAKRAAVLKLLKRLKSTGTPIHALGIQSHLLPHQKLNAEKLRSFLSDVASLGLKILITELDVIDQDLPVDTNERDRIVAATYEDYLSVVLEEPAVIAVITWGLSDRYTWLSSQAPRSDGAPVRPLLLDANFQRKLAWNALARAFDQAPKR
jgi:endo-1,4-beta-xylanase